MQVCIIATLFSILCSRKLWQGVKFEDLANLGQKLKPANNTIHFAAFPYEFMGMAVYIEHVEDAA